jgi:hypothetical protein
MENGRVYTYSAPSVIGACLLIAAVAILFTTRYPPGLFDFVVGLNRWSYRLLVYVALMTDRYPPFRLDQGSIDARVRNLLSPARLASSAVPCPSTSVA